ncbi:MAG: hypothetical protein MJ070_11210, partial [Lachnospiraceae bacterium]|nr:hypothetical protein [Lachnospiraceae bacterium]
ESRTKKEGGGSRRGRENDAEKVFLIKCDRGVSSSPAGFSFRSERFLSQKKAPSIEKTKKEAPFSRSFAILFFT